MTDIRNVVIGFLGCGNIGGGTWRLLERMGKSLEKQEGVRLSVKRILVRDVNKVRGTIPGQLLTANADDVLCDGDIQIVVELMGGVEPAATYIERALLAGKSVVTANKMALACCWTRLNDAMNKSGAGLYYEASVGGGIPIIRAVRTSLQANSFSRVLGIINGTTNYMLTEMTQRGMDYAPALEEAQRLGLAEPDPTADVSGMDAVYKLSILATLAFRAHVPFEGIYHEGITHISADDIECGRSMGYTLKLLAIAKRTPGGIEARVHPAFIPTKHTLASVSGSYNAIFLTGDAIDDMMFYGRGAGDMPTASAVVSDIVNAAHELDDEHRAPDYAEASINGNFMSRFLIRMETDYAPQAADALVALLEKHGVSIAKVNTVRHEGRISINAITNEVDENTMHAALDAARNGNTQVCSVIRVEELE